MDLHGFLIVDKPRGMTSHDVVGRVRRLLGTRRVGHAGTLDPAAEGVLVVAVGRATRLTKRVQDEPKQYLAHVVLGVETDSADVDGRLLDRRGARPARDDIVRALQRFTGEIEQTPPAHSAIKIGGEPLYRRARRGEAVDVPARRVLVTSLTVVGFQYPDLHLLIDCSKGTYIRSIARDLGDELGAGAYLHALLRTASGGFTIAHAWGLAELDSLLTPATFASMAVHPDDPLLHGGAPILALDRSQAREWYHGRLVSGAGPAGPGDGSVASAYGPAGEWLGVGAPAVERGRWQPRLVVGSPPTGADE